MKWIGQHIYDLISRFRSDVYLEGDTYLSGISTTTETSVLVVNSDGKISKSTTLADDIIESEIDTLTGLTAIGTEGEPLTIISRTILDLNRTAADGNAKAEDMAALHVDFDRIVPTSGTYAHNDRGIDLDVTSASLGTSSLYGMDIDVVGATSGTSAAYGIDLSVTGADTNIGAQIRTTGTHLKLVAGADSDDYATFIVADTGDLTIATVGDGSIDSDLTLDADGQIKLEPAVGKNILLDGTIAVDAGVVTGATSITSTAFVGDLTGQADTVATIAGLAPNTATTQATQGNITSCANLATVGTIGTGTWQGTAIASAYLDADTAHLSGTQTFTGAKTFTDTVALTGTGRITGVDTISADTDAASKGYADRPAKQIVLMRAGFKDDLGTNKHYIPLQSELEQTLYYHEMNSFVAPFAGKLLKVMYRGSGDFSGGDVSFTLEQIDRNEAFLTTPDVLETITVTGPTNDTTDPNMVTANFVGGGGTNAFVAGDMIMLGMQFDTDVTGSNSRHFFTLVFEFDFSGLA